MSSLVSRRFLVLLIAGACATGLHAQPAPAAGEWKSLFNGKDLAGWTPKIRGFELGENFGNTFRVEDGVLKVSYDQYEEFGNRFGHLFYQTPFSNYKFRLEYRFTGEQVKGGPGWALRNSGVMIHGQDPASMGKDQNFPVSLEVQLLGGGGSGERSTANLCTPGTHVMIDGQLRKEHCIPSKSKTYHGDQWVAVEVEVKDGRITHRINGETVMEYANPVLDTGDADARKLVKDDKVEITGGTISLQSESHPVEFRKIEILELKD
jgi:hypothetical protein